MPFLKEDLVGQHYNWNDTIHASALTGLPSRRFFDRSNGNQVLFIINSYGALSDKFTIADGKKMEELITYCLPDEAKSEMSVFNWLRESCKQSLNHA